MGGQQSHYEGTVVSECRKDREGACKRLLDGKADVNTRDKRGCTGLMFVVKNDNLDMAKMLLDYKADPNCHSKKRNTALHFAFEIGNRRMITLLLQHEASAKKKNCAGKTPPELTTKSYLRNLVKSTKKNVN